MPIKNRIASLFRRSSSGSTRANTKNETAGPSWNRKLFKELIEAAQFQVGDVDRNRSELLKKNTLGTLLGCQIVLTRNSDPSPGEADAVRADIVEALALAGDLAAAEKVAQSISIEGYDDVESARLSIVEGWARKDVKQALKLASITRTVSTDDEDEFVDEDEQEEKRENAMFAVLETIAKTSKPDEVIKLVSQILRLTNNPHQKNEARAILVKATAAAGKIDEARKIAAEEEVPCNQIPERLSVYQFSRGPEDVEAARAIAEKYDYEPYEQWLEIAEATHEPQDIARARAEVTAIPNMNNAKGWLVDFKRNSRLLALAKISGDPNDVVIARTALLANPETAESLFMELCRITRDQNDFALLVKSAKDDEARYSAFACIAEITKQEADFIAASKAALNINDAPRGVSNGYLRGRSLAELAQVLCGKPLHR